MGCHVQIKGMNLLGSRVMIIRMEASSVWYSFLCCSAQILLLVNTHVYCIHREWCTRCTNRPCGKQPEKNVIIGWILDRVGTDAAKNYFGAWMRVLLP